MSMRHDRDEIYFDDPKLPDFIDDLTIRNLQLGKTRADIRLRRDGGDVTVTVLSRSGPARIVQIK